MYGLKHFAQLSGPTSIVSLSPQEFKSFQRKKTASSSPAIILPEDEEEIPEVLLERPQKKASKVEAALLALDMSD